MLWCVVLVCFVELSVVLVVCCFVLLCRDVFRFVSCRVVSYHLHAFRSVALVFVVLWLRCVCRVFSCCGLSVHVTLMWLLMLHGHVHVQFRCSCMLICMLL